MSFYIQTRSLRIWKLHNINCVPCIVVVRGRTCMCIFVYLLKHFLQIIYKIQQRCIKILLMFIEILNGLLKQ